MRRASALGLALPLLFSAAVASAQSPRPRFVAATPDEMLQLAFARAERGGDDTLVGLVIAAALDERASFGAAREGLAKLALAGGPYADDARWLGLALTPGLAPEPWRGPQALAWDAPPDADGLVRSFAVLGPFHDTGGGLLRREGPEADGQRWGDRNARYSWGAYDVSWRRALPAGATARGLPLDLYVSPRTESCTYLASRVTVPASRANQALVVRVAAAGAVRVLWDGVDAVSSDEPHPRALLDRLAFRATPAAGEHLLGLKVCSGSMGDEGRVRVRFTDDGARPIALATSSDLAGVTLPAPSAVSLTRIETSLERGLALGQAKAPPSPEPKPSAAPKNGAKPAQKRADTLPPPAETLAPVTPQNALVAATLRSLGGAEDPRSPRAPGLLDRVTGEPTVDADTLAFAGWISSFGANRSGWLNLAWERATKDGDAGTRGFAQRRLVASHLGTANGEWARSLADDAPLASAEDAEARLLRAMTSERLGGVGGARAAWAELDELSTRLGERTPTSVTTELARRSSYNPKRTLAAEQRLAETVPGARDRGYVEAHRFLGPDAFEAAALSAILGATRASDVIALGGALLELSRLDSATELFELATYLAPNEPAAFEGLARARQLRASLELLRSGTPGEEDPVVGIALGRALDLTPTDTGLKAELVFRSEGASDANDGNDANEGPAQPKPVAADESYLVAPAVFLARAKSEPVVKGEISERQLHWMRVVTLHPDRRVSQLMHYAREVVIGPRTEDDLYEASIPSEGDGTELVLARVHHMDGTSEAAEEQSDGGRRPYVRWRSLAPGDIVEIAVRSWTENPVGRRGDPPFYFIDWVGSSDTSPVLANEVVIDNPDVSPLAVDVVGGKADRVLVEKKDGRTITRYVWDRAPRVPDEPLAPPLAETVPIVVGSIFHGWEEFRTWYRGAIDGFTTPDEQVRRLAAELTKDAKTRDDKIRALFNFVADDIRYVNYVSGEWWLPNRPQELLARRQGDCDDKAMLLISLLKAVGIEATEVLVQTRYTGQPRVLGSTKAAIPLFDHGIAYLPPEGKNPGIWLDATSPQSRLGPVPSMDARARGLFVSQGEAKIVELPSGSPLEYGVDADWTLTLSDTGAGELSAKETHTGDSAFLLRSNLQEKDARAQWVEQYLGSYFPAAEVEDAVDFTPDLANGAASLGYRAKSFALARREGRELAVPVAGPNTLTSMLAPLVKRVLPVVLPPDLAPGHDQRTITVVAPKGYTFAELPPGGEENAGPFGSASVTFAKVPGKGDRVRVVRRIVFDLSTIPVEQYPAWRAWLQRVDRLTHQMVRMVPVK
jgi:transglutaminase-like putative cysteine protease